MLTRRRFNSALPLALMTSSALAGCTSGTGSASYDSAVEETWRLGPLQGLDGTALATELVRYATLAPSSHNTQCWKFALAADSITILQTSRAVAQRSTPTIIMCSFRWAVRRRT